MRILTKNREAMKKEKVFFARAPVRICDIGGWTDTWFYENGAVLNMCVDLYSYVRIHLRDDQSINIISENLDLNTRIRDYRKIEYDGTLDLLKAAIKCMNIKTGMDIYVKADAPPGSGTGTSASVAVSLLAALSRVSDVFLLPFELAELAHKLETEELGLESGVQDQFASDYGGVNFMKIDYPSVQISRIPLERKLICELESQFILVYLSSRSSSKMHKAVLKNFQNKDHKTLQAFKKLEECAYQMKKAIFAANLGKIGRIMTDNWEAQKHLHPLMVNEQIKKIENLAQDEGALGLKCNGAGGGGSALILADIGKEYTLKKKLKKNGFELLPIKLNFQGVETWNII